MGFINGELLYSIFNSINPWKIATFILLAVNVKCLPLVWHYRIFSPIVRAAWAKFRRRPGPNSWISNSKIPTVFLPMVTSTYAPLLECDYNLHKSNKGNRGMVASIIGGVTTSFRKEIRMFQQYEVWSRILTWDRKWLYIVTHFVRKGSVKPKGYVAARAKGEVLDSSNGETGSHSAQPVIFATSVSKYVFKKGRLTIPPERLLQASGLLEESGNSAENRMRDKDMDGIDHDGNCAGGPGVSEAIERERLKGMKYADSWIRLDSLHEQLLKEDEANGNLVAIDHHSDIPGCGFSFP
ncbi:thioesterase family protein [Aspergillus thermomutatus]|uniref:Uncharacterized protein n=1 Tax=Aspergillus thermomutatus TaxID=41047 RepID=A0A397HU34_ASPTH|nr:uncharacterized protein CDV56_106792 [Aspergillus thermomutatus]RHZ66347.1 hypothetical protein CDV56_106792 [Aspergillus thermomutatus]